jgi:hypothetical protein
MGLLGHDGVVWPVTQNRTSTGNVMRDCVVFGVTCGHAGA